MSILAFIAALVGLHAGDTPPAPSHHWRCVGVAKGAGQSQVEVDILGKTGGKRTLHMTTWAPPRIGGRQWTAGFMEDEPELDVAYFLATPEGLGPPTFISTSVVSLRGPQILKGGRIGLVLDRQRERTAPLEMPQTWRAKVEHFIATRIQILAGPQADGSILNKELLEALETAHSGQAKLRGSKGEVLAWIRYDFSAREDRDRMYREARAEAEARALHPETCEGWTATKADPSP